MLTHIGITAGEIWQYLDQKESATLDELVRNIKKPRELVLMSLGWLSREGHVSVGDEHSNYVARLSSSSHA
ncbi:MAG: hypothetical protein A3A73_03185 [Omnitrophica bacterium RIFCSPLOWO2_01_FULL_50_24]|nr:MAG: hypothetical protein A3A73_03185 [Omnitrophica bacterium RIFCSPLOWO2_01_FULL_50_24]